MKLFFYRFIECTWGFPQSLLGFFLYLIYRKSPHTSYKGSIVTYWPKKGGISLGLFTFIENYSGRKDYLQRHEYGHTLQSLILGPFYLLIIGLPSYIWANLPYFIKMRKEKNIPYNSFFTEKNADLLGGNLNI